MNYREYATDLARASAQLAAAERRHLEPPDQEPCPRCEAHEARLRIESVLDDYEVRLPVATLDDLEGEIRDRLRGRLCGSHRE